MFSSSISIHIIVDLISFGLDHAGEIHRGARLHRLGRPQSHQAHHAAQNVKRCGFDTATVRGRTAAKRLGHAIDHYSFERSLMRKSVLLLNILTHLVYLSINA